MPKGNRQATGRPKKPHTRKTISLDDRLCPIAENSTKGATATIELGLSIMQYLAQQSLSGDPQAIALLARFGVAAEGEAGSPIVVYKPDGDVAAWVLIEAYELEGTEKRNSTTQER
jgi:hypothetical protein